MYRITGEDENYRRFIFTYYIQDGEINIRISTKKESGDDDLNLNPIYLSNCSGRVVSFGFFIVLDMASNLALSSRSFVLSDSKEALNALFI
jgi:hypothetical protein